MAPEVTPSKSGDHIVVDADPDRGNNYDLGQFYGETETGAADATASLIGKTYGSGDLGRVVIEGPTRSDSNTYFAA